MKLGGRRRGVPAASRRGEEAGYTLLLAVFFAALMIIAASAAIPNLITQDRREKEKLMIWRGRQYARAIGLYYLKTGHYPHDLKELSKKVGGVYVLRKEYKDPMGGENGSWRLIYLGAGGQLIGSLRWHTLAEYQAYQKGEVLPGTKPGSAQGSSTFSTGLMGGASTPGTTGFSQPKTQIISEGQMIGGNLIGVASKVNAKSLKVYMGADNYREWEFIWNPLEGQQNTGLPASPATGNPPSTFGPPKPSTQPNPGSTNPQSQQP